MFSKEDFDAILNRLKQECGGDPNWEQLLRDVYLGMARADAGVALGNLDARVIAILEQQQEMAENRV